VHPQQNLLVPRKRVYSPNLRSVPPQGIDVTLEVRGSTPEENIKTILADWLDALRRHDFDTVEGRMDPEVFWQGVREDFVCANREEAMEMQREQQREEHGVEALELIATEEKVVLGVRFRVTLAAEVGKGCEGQRE
jgi:hypothetical protein